MEGHIGTGWRTRNRGTNLRNADAGENRNTWRARIPPMNSGNEDAGGSSDRRHRRTRSEFRERESSSRSRNSQRNNPTQNDRRYDKSPKYRRRDRPHSDEKNGGSHDRHNNFPRTYRDQTNFPFKYVESLLEKPLAEVMQKLSQNKPFFDYIGQKLTPDYIVLVVKLLGSISNFEFPHLRIVLLQNMLNSGFVENLQSYIGTALPFQNFAEMKRNSYYWKDPDSFWNNLLKFCTVTMDQIPHFFIDKLLKLVKISSLNIPEIEQKHQVHLCDEIKENLKVLSNKAEYIIANSNQSVTKKTEIADDREEEPPDDFHEISIFPTTHELLQTMKPFLRKNIVIGAYRDVNHYLDVQFRLLREDFVGPLRNGIQKYLNGDKFRDIQDIKIHQKVQFMNPIAATEHYCVMLKFQFDGKVNKLKYEDSRKFMFGSLVCFTNDNFNTILFGRIVDRKIEYLKNGQLVIGFDNPEELSYNTEYVMVECSIYFEPYYHVLKVLKGIREEDFPMKNYIVEVDKTVLMPEFASPMEEYTTRCYDQNIRWLPFGMAPVPVFPDLNTSQNDAYVAALTRQFSIIQGPPGTGKTYVGLKIAKTLLRNSESWCKNSPMLVICFTNHALDQFLEGLIDTTQKIIRIGGQSKNEKLRKFNLREQARRMNPAVWRARTTVTHSMTLIKNVTDEMHFIKNKKCILNLYMLASVIPNYGESWLANAKEADFLEWLLDGNIPKNDEKLVDNTENGLSLRQQFEIMKIDDSEDEVEEEDNEKNELDELFGGMETNNEKLLDLDELHRNITYNYFRLNALRSEMQNDEEQLFQYITLESRTKRLQNIYEFVEKKLATPANQFNDENVIDVRYSKYIPVDERWNLYFFWVHLYQNKLLQKYDDYNANYRRELEIYNELREIGNVEILRDMKVIGMTTTCAARLHSSLQVLKCPIVIVEEAAEVLEAHIISALTKSCKQLILIGDHQQLRPNTSNYHIEKDYNLGISLFERMVRNEVQCFTLEVQHRMRPEISALIKPTIYPNLRDHESVMNRPLINGVDKCLFFIDHKFPELSHNVNSKKNIHEAKFLIQLARYLILNGYEPHQITILAAYLGQMFEMQREKKKMYLLQNVRISVLDNYQGEESDIILLSLVRNNEENNIGFLSIDNRVCVALSRARNGLYIMGNMNLLCNKSQLWVKIRQTFLHQESIGSSLPLRCQNHKNVTMVTTDSDFSLVSEGGCNQICDSSLVCGHRCKSQCHSLDKDHEKYCCPEICNRPLCDSDVTHICKKSCGEECGPCIYPKQVILDCGHHAVMQCHVSPEDYCCTTEVPVTLPCGHDAIKPCYRDTETFKCQIPCDVRLDCGHSCMLKCHVFKDPAHLLYKCPKPCAKFRAGCKNLEDNEHLCSKLCYEECEPCKKLVRKARTICPHFFDIPCSDDVDDMECYKPCKKILECGHKCMNKCFEPCSTCNQKVKKQIPGCNHTMQLPCKVEADRKLCNKKCPRIMECGHICGGICKYPCDVSKCKEMVKVYILAKCGHIVEEVPCFVKTLYDTAGESAVKNLESYCTEPCRALLNCRPDDKHPCGGTCGSCYQGRIHKRCTKKCNAILICNHECTGFCRETCKPCSMKCSFKCKHSICKKRCGDECTVCKEPCNRRCEHQRCTRKCGQICNVPPCEMPCKKRLKKCGHPCIGFCSEPCPQLCRICDKEEVEEFFFGTEDEEDARFILLNDCNHVLEHTGMKQWLNQDSDAIQFKVCPKCKTKIFSTERYSDYVKKAVRAISAAKIKGIGTQKNISEKCSELSTKIKSLSLGSNFSMNVKSQFLRKSLFTHKETLSERLEKVSKIGQIQHVNLVDLNAIEIKLQLTQQVFKIMELPDITFLISDFVPTIEGQVDLILTSLLREVDDITTTEIEDIQREINRLLRMVQILPLLQKHRELNVTSALNTEIIALNNLINTLSKFDNQINDTVKEGLVSLRKKCSVRAITELEKQNIVKAMGLSKGHWYQCPNGHPYVITECGGAMEMGRCNECQAEIGGGNHRLLSSNRVATFMDGATHPAWSEYNNMNNYNF